MPMARYSGSSNLQIDRFASHHHHPRNVKIRLGVTLTVFAKRITVAPYAPEVDKFGQNS